VKRLGESYGISVRKACRALDWHRSTHHYRSRRADTTELRRRIRELALSRPRYGYRRIHILLRREGRKVNHKKTYRRYKEERLSLRIPRKKRKYASVVRVPPRKPERPNELWAIDFMSDAQTDGRRFRVFTVIDVSPRKSLSVTAERTFPSRKETAVLDRLIAESGKPEVITLDNGTEFTSKHFDAWAYQRSIKLDFIRPGKPVENCFIESFNGRVRDECLNVHWFETLDEARKILEDWRSDYNEMRPHSSLADQVPKSYLDELLEVTNVARTLIAI
jgi:putative transposase